MARDELSGSTGKPVEALERMLAALQILDELEAPGDIGSHLDLAIARLRQRFGLPGGADPSADVHSRPTDLGPATLEDAIADTPERSLLPPL